MGQHQNRSILTLSKAQLLECGYCASCALHPTQFEQFCSRKFKEKYVFPLFRSFSQVMNHLVMIYIIRQDILCVFGELTKHNWAAAQISPLCEWIAELLQILDAKSLSNYLKALQIQSKSCSEVFLIWYCSREVGLLLLIVMSAILQIVREKVIRGGNVAQWHIRIPTAERLIASGLILSHIVICQEWLPVFIC